MTARVRQATREDLVAVLNVLDGAALETDYEAIRARLERGDVLVAVAENDSDRVLAACELDGERVVAIAVRKRRRGQGIGTALIRAAVRDRNRLVAEFDADARPFYEALGFGVTQIDGGRYEGVLERIGD
ncbi:MAG: GNAT family N-acetyltransferase [Halorhabdus sp.]